MIELPRVGWRLQNGASPDCIIVVVVLVLVLVLVAKKNNVRGKCHCDCPVPTLARLTSTSGVTDLLAMLRLPFWFHESPRPAIHTQCPQRHCRMCWFFVRHGKSTLRVPVVIHHMVMHMQLVMRILTTLVMKLQCF